MDFQDVDFLTQILYTIKSLVYQVGLCMNKKNVEKAIEEAKRFIVAASDLLYTPDISWEITGSAKSGMVRRASMDLTRILAQLRKPR